MSRALVIRVVAAWLLVCLWLPGRALADDAGSVALLVRETAEVERGPWPVSGGVGLPDGLLPASAVSEGRVALLDAEGSEIRCQTRVLSVWPAVGTGGPHVRALGVSFLTTVAAGAEARYELRWTMEATAGEGAVAPTRVVTREMAGATVVRNGTGPGAMMLVVDGHRGRGLLESVAIDEAGDGFADDLPLIGDRRLVTSSVSYADPGLHQAELGFCVPDVVVEESGPVRAIVRVHSEYDSRLSMVHRLAVYAGLPLVFVQCTLYTAPSHTATGALRLLSHTTSLPLGMLESPDVIFGAAGGGAPAETRATVVPGKPLAISSRKGAAGFSAMLGDDPLADVPAPLGWVEAACRGRRVALCLGGMPSRSLQRLEIGEGRLVVDFCASELNLTRGQSLTEEYLLYFPQDLATLEPAGAAHAFAEPLYPATAVQGEGPAGGGPRPASDLGRGLPEWGAADYESRAAGILESVSGRALEMAEGEAAEPNSDWVAALVWEFGQTADPRWLEAARGLAVRLCDGRPTDVAGLTDAVSACADLTGDGRLWDALRPPGGGGT